MSWTDILVLVVKWLVPVACGAVAGVLGMLLKNAKRRNTALEKGVQCLLRAELMRLHETYTNARNCSVYERESYLKMYNAYHELGGNDIVTRMKGEIMDLPIKVGTKK